jgi:transposase-like protein
MNKQFSSDLKLKAIKYYNKINNYAEVCRIFKCSERSLKRSVEKYKNVDRKERKHCSYKIKTKDIKFIKEQLKKTYDIHIKFLH